MQFKERPLSLALVIAVALGLAILAWLTLSRSLSGQTRVLRPSPFGLEPGKRVARGMDFTAASSVRKAAPKTRVLWEEVALALAGEPQPRRLDALEEALAALRPEAEGFDPALWAEALAKADSALLGKAMDTLAGNALIQGLRKQGHPFGLYAAGCLGAVLGDTSLAKEAWQKAVDKAPDFAFAWARLGEARLHLGQIEEAREAFHMAIALMEDDTALYLPSEAATAEMQRDLPRVEAPPYGGLAQTYLALGQADTAAQVLTYGQERKGWNATMALAKAWLWEHKGEDKKARDLYDSLMGAQPGFAHAARLRKSMGLKGSSDAEGLQALFAIRTLDTLVRAYPGNAPLRLGLAKAYVQRGLYGMAVMQLDTALSLDASVAGGAALRQGAFARWMAEEEKVRFKTPDKARETDAAGEEDRVVIPSTIGLLGTYSVPWFASSLQVRQAYPDKRFVPTGRGHWVDSFTHEGLTHVNLLAFDGDSLRGMLAVTTDQTGNHIDVFGRMIRIKTKISGEGRGTGEATCPGYRTFQGAIWQNDDTFEFMAQFQGKENEVRLARMAYQALPYDRRLCELVKYLDRDTWLMPQGKEPQKKPAQAQGKKGKAAKAQANKASKAAGMPPRKFQPASTDPIITPSDGEYGDEDPNDLSNYSGENAR